MNVECFIPMTWQYGFIVGLGLGLLMSGVLVWLKERHIDKLLTEGKEAKDD